MDISFEQLKSMVVFAQVIKQGNFSAAARKLGISRAVVSYHIKKLESQLNLKLINRSTRSLSLTEAGAVYYENCKTISEQARLANQLIDNFKDEPAGLIKITCPVNLGLQLIVPALNKFKQLYPKIELDIDLTDRVANILQEGYDLAIRGAPLQDSSLQASKLCVLKTCICGAPSYFKKHGYPKSIDELQNHQWVIYNLAPKELKIKRGNKTHLVNLSGIIATNNAAARTMFVENGHGLARIPLYDARPRTEEGTLVTIFDEYQVPDINLFGVFPQGTANLKKMRVLLDFLKDYLESRT